MKVEIKTEIDMDKVLDLIVCAFEGGSNYWYRIEDKLPDYYAESGDKMVKFFEDGNGLKISNHQISSVGEDKRIEGVLNTESISRALTEMNQKYNKHYTDFITENHDAITGDVFLQLAIIGEIRYG